MSQKKIDGFRFLRLCVFCDYSVFLITIYTIKSKVMLNLFRMKIKVEENMYIV